MKNFLVDDINKQLLLHGTNEYGEPIFRVVFSDDQTENRFSTYADYHNNIFVREVKEVREVRKYPWLNGKWILERWASGREAYHKDLRTVKNGLYICVYVFQDVNQNYLPPMLRVCEIIIDKLLHPISRTEMIERDLKEFEKQEQAEFDRDLLEIQIASDEKKTKDPKSRRESMSEGYVKEFKGEDNG